MTDQLDDVDFAVAAYRQAGAWPLQDLADTAIDSVESLGVALRRLGGLEGAVGLVGVDEDWFVIVRVAGTTTRVLLSDVTAAEEWELAQSAVDFLGLPTLDSDDEEPAPAGDLDLLSDLGVRGNELTLILEDDDLYPDEMLSDIATQLGFGEEFDDLVGLTSA